MVGISLISDEMNRAQATGKVNKAEAASTVHSAPSQIPRRETAECPKQTSVSLCRRWTSASHSWTHVDLMQCPKQGNLQGAVIVSRHDCVLYERIILVFTRKCLIYTVYRNQDL